MLQDDVVKVDYEKQCGDDSECISSLTVTARPELDRSVHSSHYSTFFNEMSV